LYCIFLELKKKKKQHKEQSETIRNFFKNETYL